MSENLHLVFSKPSEGLSDEEYNRWYDFHQGEILAVPGFVAARRNRLETIRGDWTPSSHRYLSAYELGGDPRDVMRERGNRASRWPAPASPSSRATW